MLRIALIAAAALAAAAIGDSSANQPTGRAHTVVHVAAGGPPGDRWNLAAAELINSG